MEYQKQKKRRNPKAKTIKKAPKHKQWGKKNTKVFLSPLGIKAKGGSHPYSIFIGDHIKIHRNI